MEMHRAMRFSLYGCLLIVMSLAMAAPLASQDPGVTLRSTTWQQDSPSICTGCVYRTGQNLGQFVGTVRCAISRWSLVLVECSAALNFGASRNLFRSVCL